MAKIRNKSEGAEKVLIAAKSGTFGLKYREIYAVYSFAAQKPRFIALECLFERPGQSFLTLFQQSYNLEN